MYGNRRFQIVSFLKMGRYVGRQEKTGAEGSGDRRAFLPLPCSFSLANPPFLEVMRSKHGDILVLPESSTIDDGYWNAEKIVNEKESHRLFNNAISLCSFSTILWGMLAKPKKPWLGTA